MDSLFWKRFWIMTIGVLGMGAFLSLLLQAGYGVDTSAFMNSSLSQRIGIPLGTVLLATNIILFIPQLIWGRKLIGIGTIVNMTLIGYTSDFCTMLEERYISPAFFIDQPSRAILFMLSLAGFLFFAALYMNAGLGQAPYDSIPTMLSRRTGLPFFAVRMAWDFLTIALGILAGGHLTIGTVLMALTIGPTVAWIGKHLLPIPIDDSRPVPISR